MATAPQTTEPPWKDDLLAEDVASISYERALRSRARIRPQSLDPLPPPTPVESSKTGTETKPAPLKTASITIRLSETECEQLRRRASEAGMTMSAYLRSCTLEVESLRAQVKQTLAEIRSAAPKPEQEVRPKSGRVIRSFLSRVWRWLREFGPASPPAVPLNPGNPFAPARY